MTISPVPDGDADGDLPRGTYFAALGEAVRLVWPYWTGIRWAAPLVLLLGLVAAVAESGGIGVIIVLMTMIFGGGTRHAIDEDGLVGMFTQKVLALTGDNVSVVAGLALGLVVLRVLSITSHHLASALAGEYVSERVRHAIFDAFLTMPLEALNARSYGAMLMVLDRHSWAVAEATDTTLRMVLNAVIGALIGLLLLRLSPIIAGIALIGTLTLTLGLTLVDRPAERAGERSSAAAMAVSGSAAAVLQAMRTVRAFGGGGAAMARYATASAALRRAGLKSDVTGSIAEPASHLAYLAMLALIMGAAYYRDLDLGTIVAAVLLLYRLQPYVSAAEGERLHLAGLLGPLRAVREIVALAEPPREGMIRIGRFAHEIRFDGVTFGYRTQPVLCLRDASFAIEQGRWTLVSGPSGSGKSTIVNLLLGFYAPQGGRVLIDGVPLADVDMPSWLSQLAVAGQDVELIDGTLADNVRLGAPHANEAALARAMTIAGLDAVVDELADGADAAIGERGLKLSGGQRQRIGIARAVLCDPHVLILDEATSALDSASENAILQRLQSAFADRTVIVIGHHLHRAALPFGRRIVLTGGGATIEERDMAEPIIA